MSRLKRYSLMASFWFMALISMGSATPVPSTNAWAVVRRSDGTIATTVDDPMAGEMTIHTQLEADLLSLTATEFEAAWGIEAT